jgi:hypothetical protein
MFNTRITLISMFTMPVIRITSRFFVIPLFLSELCIFFASFKETKAQQIGACSPFR